MSPNNYQNSVKNRSINSKTERKITLCQNDHKYSTNVNRIGKFIQSGAKKNAT